MTNTRSISYVKMVNHLFSHRKDLKLTQKDIAIKLKTTQKKISDFENCVQELNICDIFLLCYLLKHDPKEFMEKYLDSFFIEYKEIIRKLI